MSAITDLLLTAFPVKYAVLFAALATVDYVQVRWMDSRLTTHETRIERVEGVAMTDGGEPADE